MALKDIFGKAAETFVMDEYARDIEKLRHEYEREMNQRVSQGMVAIGSPYGQANNTTASSIQAQQQASMNAMQNAVISGQGVYTSTLGNSLIGNSAAGIGINAATASPRIDPNEDPAYSTPLSTIKGMWQVKFGDSWVKGSTLKKEDFWAHANERLWHADLLERMDEQHGYWYRIKE